MVVGEVWPLRSPFKRSINSRDDGLTAPSYQHSDPPQHLLWRQTCRRAGAQAVAKRDKSSGDGPLWPRAAFCLTKTFSKLCYSLKLFLPSPTSFPLTFHRWFEGSSNFHSTPSLFSLYSFLFFFLTKNCLLCTFDSFLVSTSQKLQTNTMH